MGDQGGAGAGRSDRGRSSSPTRRRPVGPRDDARRHGGRRAACRPHTTRRRHGPRPARSGEACAHDLARRASTRRHSAADIVAGLLAVGSIVLSAFAMGLGLILEVDARPARTSFVAIILALVSARLSARYQSLALKAVLVRDGRLGRRDDACGPHRKPADLGRQSAAAPAMPTGTTHRDERAADLSGLNAGYVAQMLEAYLDAPASVPDEWRELFEQDPGGFAGIAARARRPSRRSGERNRRARVADRPQPSRRPAAPPAVGARPPAARRAGAPRRRDRLRLRRPPAAARRLPSPTARPPRPQRRSTRPSSAASPRRWRSSRPTGCTGTWRRGSIRSAPSRWATLHSTSPGSSRR